MYNLLKKYLHTLISDVEEVINNTSLVMACKVEDDVVSTSRVGLQHCILEQDSLLQYYLTPRVERSKQVHSNHDTLRDDAVFVFTST